MTKELADSIRRCLADCEKLEQFETGNVIIQLVELVEEMRKYTDHAYHCPANHCFENDCTCKVYDIEAKADALLKGLRD
jgi:hypothetical protein